MHYYKFNIGDYASHTRHLSLMEDLAYRRLLDVAYTSEKPLSKDTHALSRLIGMREYQSEVEDILREFFDEVEEGWIHGRVLKEIDEASGRSDKAKTAAVTRWERKRNADAMQAQCLIDAPSIENNAPSIKNDATQDPLHTTHYPLPITKEKQNLLSPPAAPKADPIPYERIVNLYHEKLPTLPKVAKLSSKRKGQIAARWRSGDIPDLETWQEYFTFVSQSDWLMGKVEPSQGRKRFVADLEWLTNESNFIKTWENKYHGR